MNRNEESSVTSVELAEIEITVKAEFEEKKVEKQLKEIQVDQKMQTSVFPVF